MSGVISCCLVSVVTVLLSVVSKRKSNRVRTQPCPAVRARRRKQKFSLAAIQISERILNEHAAVLVPRAIVRVGCWVSAWLTTLDAVIILRLTSVHVKRECWF